MPYPHLLSQFLAIASDQKIPKRFGITKKNREINRLLPINAARVYYDKGFGMVTGFLQKSGNPMGRCF